MNYHSIIKKRSLALIHARLRKVLHFDSAGEPELTSCRPGLTIHFYARVPSGLWATEASRMLP